MEEILSQAKSNPNSIKSKFRTKKAPNGSNNPSNSENSYLDFKELVKVKTLGYGSLGHVEQVYSKTLDCDLALKVIFFSIKRVSP